MQDTHNRTQNVRHRVLWPLASTLVFILCLFLLTSHVYLQRQIEWEQQRQVQSVDLLYADLLEQRTEYMRALLGQIADSAPFRQAMRAEDRDLLLKLASPLLETELARSSITHFYFHRPDRTNFLRVHNPARYGDPIGRHTLDEAARTGQPGAGVELGASTTLTLRVVIPWTDGPTLLGYLELGEEIAPIIDHLGKLVDASLLVSINKTLIDRRQWDAGMAMLGRKGDWDLLQNQVLTTPLPPHLEPAFTRQGVARQLQRGPHLKLSTDAGTYKGKLLPLRNAAGEQVGHLWSLWDITSSQQGFYQSMTLITVLCIVLGSFLITLASVILGRTDHDLARTRLRLVGEIEKTRLAKTRLEGEVAEHRQTEAALQASRDLLEIRVAERTRMLNEQNQLLESLVANIPSHVCWLDRRLNYLGCNPGFARLVGLNHPDHLAGKTDGDLLWGVAQQAELQEAYRQVLAEGKPLLDVELNHVDPDGRETVLTRSIVPLTTGEGDSEGLLCIMGDVTERKQTEKAMWEMAYYDMLTSLPNRLLLLDRLDQAMNRAKRELHNLAVLFLDLDRFKDVNDTLGHAHGDELLKATARRLETCVRQNDTVARLGGDEFVILLDNLTHEADASVVALKVLEQMAEPFTFEGSEVFTSTSIGIVLYPMDGDTPEALLKHADMAMYAAKDRGRNNFQFFSEEMNREAMQRREFESNLRRALEREQLYLVYQPQMDLASGRMTGVEALLRWRHPELGLIPPDQFIPVAEETGLILPIGEWVLREACTQAQAWQEEGLPPLKVAVNISSRQFDQPNFFAQIENILADTGLAPASLELEVTESILMGGTAETTEMLGRLKALGPGLAIDDFGTGYSSLSYLKRFPIDRVKIAQEFVLDIPSSNGDAAIVETIIAMGRSLDMKVIAEGVETRDQLTFLQGHGCHEVQGYYFSRPLEAADLTSRLRELRGLDGLCPYQDGQAIG